MTAPENVGKPDPRRPPLAILTPSPGMRPSADLACTLLGEFGALRCVMRAPHCATGNPRVSRRQSTRAAAASRRPIHARTAGRQACPTTKPHRIESYRTVSGVAAGTGESGRCASGRAFACGNNRSPNRARRDRTSTAVTSRTSALTERLRRVVSQTAGAGCSANTIVSGQELRDKTGSLVSNLRLTRRKRAPTFS